MLWAHAMVDAIEPILHVIEDEVDDRHELFGRLGGVAFGNGVVIIAACPQAGIAAPIAVTISYPGITVLSTLSVPSPACQSARDFQWQGWRDRVLLWRRRDQLSGGAAWLRLASRCVVL